jgi:hypothetical protein
MDYKHFMDEVKLHMDKMNEKEMYDFIFELARVTSKYKRTNFLSKFEKADIKKIKNRQERIEAVNKLCEDIENGEIQFSCTSYQDGSYSYWEQNWVNEYSDPEGLAKLIEDSFLFIKNLIYEQSYNEAVKLYDHLLSLSYAAYDEDTGEVYEFDLKELVDEDLINIDVEDFCSHVLYASYQSKTGKERTEHIYNIFKNTLFKNTTLESMLSVGPVALDGVDIFMNEFNKFIMDKQGDLETRLLIETINFLKVDSLKFARNVSKTHPGLYYNLFKQAIDKGNEKEAICIGSEAIDYIPKEMTIRSKIALLTGDIHKKLNNIKLYRKCLLEGFISESTPYNFLKLFSTCSQEEIEEAYQFSKNISLQEHIHPQDNYNQTAQNHIKKIEQDIIRFFYGDLVYAQRKCISDEEYLGWSTSFKGVAVPIFLVLLEKNHKDSKVRRQIMEFIYRKIDVRKKYYSFNFEYDPEFDILIQNWKKKISIGEEKNFYLKWIEEEVDKRVEAVVGGGYRKSYYKGAELIVYLGQVLESLGEENAAKDLVKKYKKKYSRKSAFKAEIDKLL